MKKYRIILVCILVLGITSVGVLSNTVFVDAANNECSAGYTDTNYISKLNYEVNGNVVSYTGAEGLLYSTSFDGTQYPANEDGTFSFTIPDAEMSSRITVYFYLAESDGVCDSGKEVGNNTIYADTSSRNQLYDNALCVNYRNKWSKNETMKDAVSYCFTEEVSVQYSYDEVASWIREAESLYEMSQSGSTEIVQDPSYTNVDDVKDTDKLVCDAFSNTNYEKMNKYSHIETNTVNSCTTTCKEEIEVNFSDPVATQPGLCFQYLIEIKSKVDCDSKYTAPKPGRPAVCVPTARCVASNGYQSDKGGPVEDFDACVQECDGGEYSQKCIDSCYTKVYGEEDDILNEKVDVQTTFEPIPTILTNDTTILDSNTQTTKLANGCLTPWNVSGTGQAQALYEQHQKDPGGKYSGSKWIPSKSGCSSKIGQFYFRSLGSTIQTIREAKGWYSDSQGRKQYAAGSNGFLVRTKMNGSTNVCDDTCRWINKCGSNTVLTQYLANKQYQEELAKWEKNKAACESKALECSSERTDYEIIVENKDNNDTSENIEDWTESFNAHQNMNSNTVIDDWVGANSKTFESMVWLATGTCEDTGAYEEGNDELWNYHNIITFPGTWINNKTGRPVHSIEPGNEDFYTYVGNEYCTKLNSIPVNTAWYDFVVNQGGDASSLTDTEKSEITADIEYNIKGSIDNYGYFGWNFDVSCFYAIGDDITEKCPSDDPDCDTKPNGNDGSNDDYVAEDFKFRPISLNTLFPSNDGSNNSREAGFNWTCDATNLENEDYPVQPVALLEDIQRLGDDVYTDEYVDYEFNLTSEDMDRIRAYNKDNDGDYDKPVYESQNISIGNNKTAGITVYKSAFLHKYLGKGVMVKSGIIGCNNQDGDACQGIIEDTRGCMREYQAQASLLKGVK